MTAVTSRIPVLVTPREKAAIEQKARAADLSVGEYMRQAAKSFTPADDERILSGMIDQMVKTTARAGEAVDATLKFIEASNRRIAAMEKKGRPA